MEKPELRMIICMQSLETLAVVLDNQEASQIRENVRDTLYTTGPLPMDVFNKVEDLRKAYDDVEEKREILIQRFRRAIGADNI